MDIETVIRAAFISSALLINGCRKDKLVSESAMPTKNESIPSSTRCSTSNINISSDILQERTLCSYASTPDYRKVFIFLYDNERYVLKYLDGDVDKSGTIAEAEMLTFKPKETSLPGEGYLFAYLPEDVERRDVIRNGLIRGYTVEITIDTKLSDVK